MSDTATKPKMDPNLKQWLIQTEGIGGEYQDNERFEKVTEAPAVFTGSLSFGTTQVEIKPNIQVNLSQGVSELTQSTIKVTEEAVKAVGAGTIETFNAGSDLLNMVIKGPSVEKKTTPDEQKKTIETQVYLENRNVIAQTLSEYKSQVDIAIGKERVRLLGDVGGASMSLEQLNEVQGKNKNYLHKLELHEIVDVRRMIIEQRQTEEQKKSEQSLANAAPGKDSRIRNDLVAEGGSMLSTTGGNVG